MLGNVAGPEAYPVDPDTAAPISRGEISEGAKDRVKFNGKKRDAHATQHWGQ